jgi:hypothetical protein
VCEFHPTIVKAYLNDRVLLLKDISCYIGRIRRPDVLLYKLHTLFRSRMNFDERLT